MLSSVLRSKRAAEVNIAIMRAFVRLRQMFASNERLARKLTELERQVAGHDKHIRALIVSIRKLMSPKPPKGARRIGFRAGDKEDD